MARYQGGMIGSLANTTDGTNYTGKANGVFSLPQQIVNKRSSTWAIGQTVPNPPTIGTATGVGSGQIQVAFIPPVQNGGSSITSYTVTSSGGQTATGASSPIVVGGLTNGTSYTFTVTATNALGISISSGTSNSATILVDPYFSSVSLLLNGDGTNGSQVFNDLSSSPKTVTAYSNAQISTSTKKFGTGAMYFDGNGDYLTFPANSSLALGAGDFTVEFWIYNTGNTNPIVNGVMCSAANTSIWTYYTGAWQITFGGTSNSLNFGWSLSSGGSSYDGSTTITIPTNIWSHVAFTRVGTTLKTFLNGTLSATNSLPSNFNFTTDGLFEIGRHDGRDNYYLNGYLDDIRITKGIARYTTNFTPPTAAFPTS
jgi:hypothetical protein